MFSYFKSLAAFFTSTHHSVAVIFWYLNLGCQVGDEFCYIKLFHSIVRLLFDWCFKISKKKVFQKFRFLFAKIGRLKKADFSIKTSNEHITSYIIK